ncbi:hypothetical protein [Phytoactinopolyspora mesophila]|uniref:Alpha-galactosidase n=1 Tax=Phytoactinopolyspora mesophila TaxID=2650750 RepID=A0A7K3MBH7_9ACTN|nr:hypothetical protein [Phytoactinopolyspora mesophila]NDL60510.1 hypothetical protein [Phytoactinopolyspora mesophila]
MPQSDLSMPREATRTENSGVEWTRSTSGFTVTGVAYVLDIDHGQPRAVLQDRAADGPGKVWTELSLLGSLDLMGTRDESYDIQPARIADASEGAVEFVVEMAGHTWAEKAVHVRCSATEVVLWIAASGPRAGRRDAGANRLVEVTLLGGRAILPNGAGGTFRSSIRFASLFSPTPTEPVHVVRPASAASSLGVVGDASPGRLHGIFSPPPLCWALGDQPATGAADVPDGRWWGMSVRAPVAELTMTSAQYSPLDGGFCLRLDYEGHTRIGPGTWRSPEVVLRPAATPWQAIADYRDDLVARDLAPDLPEPPPRWWAEPIFCGWGAQCARAATMHADEPGSDGAGLVGGATVVKAADLARQDVYDEFLSTMGRAGLDPGTIVIDDRWQASYGTATIDPAKWPDLRGWIADQHQAGRKVLLWWKAWDPEGVPVEECVLDPVGRPVAVDVANPAYLDRLTRIVTHLLGPDGLDADGFKVDFTQRAPSGMSLRAHEGTWGIAALHTLLGTIHRAAKVAKPDALIVTHTPHPSFGDVCDMVRLNDVLEWDAGWAQVPVVDQLRFRHAVVAASLPGHLLDTDQWPMPDRASWRAYVEAQAALGVPALYYLEAIDNSGEPLTAADLALVARTWKEYRDERT